MNPSDQKATITVDEAARAAGISRNAAYAAVKRGEIPSMRFGRRVVVLRVPFERMLGK